MALAEAKRRGLKIDTRKGADFIDSDPVRWIETHFRVPETPDKHFYLAPYQKLALYDALSTGEDGRLNYSIVVWSDIKKSVKSSIAAAVALWHAWQLEWGQILLIANDLKQADSRVGYYLRRAIELNPDMRSICKVRNYKVTLPNKTIIESIPIDPTGEAGSNADRIVISELWGGSSKAQERMWCFDDQTELLTLRGWVGCNDFCLDDMVATFDSETERIGWELPKGLYREQYNGTMHLYENDRFSHCVTPNHRLYGKYSYSGKKESKYTKSGIMISSDLMISGFSYFHPRTSCRGAKEVVVLKEYIEIEKTKFKDSYKIAWSDWCEFMGWYLSEGFTKKNFGNPVTVTISQCPIAHPEKWERIKALLERIFGKSGFSIRDKNKAFYIHSAPLAKLVSSYGFTSFDKFVPSGIKNSSPENLWAFLYAYLLGDGHLRNDGVWTVSTSSKQMADDLQEIALKLGFVANIRISKDNGKDYFRLILSSGRDGYTRCVERKDWRQIDYNGVVWCPSVSTGIVVTRRKGKICITGNTEATLSPTKYGYSQRWVETYAGFSGESTLLERLYEQGTQDGNLVEWANQVTPPLEAYKNPSIGMFCLWNTVPRLSWQTPAYYASEAAILAESEFNRVHRNKWSTSVETFVPLEWWDMCRVISMMPMDKNDSAIMAVDAAVSGDCFAVIVVGGDGSGNLQVRYARKWTPPLGRKLDFSEPEEEIRRLLNEYNIIEIAYDPYQLEDMAGRLNRDLIAHVYAFNQGQERVIADKSLRDMIQGRKINHSGEPDLREHIQNANAQILAGEKGLRIIKKSDSKKIDLAVALSMAVSRAVYWSL